MGAKIGIWRGKLLQILQTEIPKVDNDTLWIRNSPNYIGVFCLMKIGMPRFNAGVKDQFKTRNSYWWESVLQNSLESKLKANLPFAEREG